MLGIMGCSAAFAQAACAKKQAGNELRFVGSTADPTIYELSCVGDITIESIKDGASVTATYSGITDTQVSIQADANTEVAIKGDVTKLMITSPYGSGYNKITSIDLSKCSALKTLGLGYISALTSLDLSSCVALESVNCENCTGLTTINLPTSTDLKTLNLNNCQSLTSLDLSSCVAIESVDCNNCQALTSLNLPISNSLLHLTCANCAELTTLDLSANTNLQDLNCSNCAELTTLDLSANTNLQYSNCNGCTELTTLDLSANTAIEGLELDGCTKLVSISYPATNEDAATAVANAITNATAADGTVYTDSAAAYYSTIATAATTKGWTIAQL